MNNHQSHLKAFGMKSTSPTRSVEAAASASAALPTLQQLMALAIARLQFEIQDLSRIPGADPNWNDDDFQTPIAIEMLDEKVARMASMTFATAQEFATEWFKLGAVVDLAVRAHIQRDNWYFRSLEAVSALINSTPEMLYFLEKRASASG